MTKLQEVVNINKGKGYPTTTRDADNNPTDNEKKFITVKEFDEVTVFLGKIPVMIRSSFCQLKGLQPSEIVKNAKECTFDQGGYFIINGGEKVIIANERMASNIVLVFNKKQPSKYSWIAEIRSQGDNSNKPP